MDSGLPGQEGKAGYIGPLSDSERGVSFALLFLPLQLHEPLPVARKERGRPSHPRTSPPSYLDIRFLSFFVNPLSVEQVALL
jgi:hypothetical protein